LHAGHVEQLNALGRRTDRRVCDQLDVVRHVEYAMARALEVLIRRRGRIGLEHQLLHVRIDDRPIGEMFTEPSAFSVVTIPSKIMKLVAW